MSFNAPESEPSIVGAGQHPPNCVRLLLRTHEHTGQRRLARPITAIYLLSACLLCQIVASAEMDSYDPNPSTQACTSPPDRRHQTAYLGMPKDSLWLVFAALWLRKLCEARRYTQLSFQLLKFLIM